MHDVRALVFDAYGTLFDVYSVASACDAEFPGRGAALSQLWRAKQLEYSWLRSLMGRYEDFWSITEAALTFACRALGLPLDEATRGRLMGGYLALDAYLDVPVLMAACGERPLAILSNGAPQMLRAVVEHNRLADRFAAVISVDEVRVYKPEPRVYELAERRLGLPRAAIGFVSSNGWDAIGAAAYGFRVCWINRAGAPLDELGAAPAVVVGGLGELAALL